MLESRPSPTPGAIVGYVLMAGILLLDAGLLLLLFNQPVTVVTFIWGALLFASGPTIANIAYWTSTLSVARYAVEEETVIIEWAHVREIVPFEQFRYIGTGERVERVERFRGMCWPGCWIGHGYVTLSDQQEENLSTAYFATRPSDRQLILATDTAAYAISPSDQANFLDCLQALRVSKSEKKHVSVASTRSFLDWPIWRDRVAGTALFTATLLNGGLFAFLTLIYARLPLALTLTVDQAGIVTRTVPPVNLFVLPVLGLIASVSNGVLGTYFYQIRGERPPAYLLWGASIIVQLITWVALLTILR